MANEKWARAGESPPALSVKGVKLGKLGKV